MISEYVKRFGVTIMYSHRFQLTPSTVLEFYLQCDSVEKIFDTISMSFDGKRLRGHSKPAIDGRLLIKFLALIFNEAIEETVKKNESLKQYSILELMYELKKLFVIEMSDKMLYLTEISSLQKKIFKAFKLENPVI
jgi:transposase